MNESVGVRESRGITDPWYNLDAEEVCQSLHTSQQRGLDLTEANERLAFWGPNKIE
nr:hypothetical protein [Fodinibius sp.]NIY26628.1 hypothetical protein [Fodinibius sp.]